MRWLLRLIVVGLFVAGLLIWAYWDEEPDCEIRIVQIGNSQYPNCIPKEK